MADTRSQLEALNNATIFSNVTGPITATALNLLILNMIVSTTIPLSDMGAGVQTALTFDADTPGGFLTFSNLAAAITAYFNSLPTTLPLTPGVVWNNAGSVSIS